MKEQSDCNYICASVCRKNLNCIGKKSGNKMSHGKRSICKGENSKNNKDNNVTWKQNAIRMTWQRVGLMNRTPNSAIKVKNRNLISKGAFPKSFLFFMFLNTKLEKIIQDNFYILAYKRSGMISKIESSFAFILCRVKT